MFKILKVTLLIKAVLHDIILCVFCIGIKFLLCVSYLLSKTNKAKHLKRKVDVLITSTSRVFGLTHFDR